MTDQPWWQACTCGHVFRMHFKGGFCMVEVIGDDLDKTVDACSCGQFTADNATETPDA